MLSQPLHLMITLNSYTEIHTSCNVVTAPTFNDYSEFRRGCDNITTGMYFCIGIQSNH
jgi:hypothetical protein